VATAETVSEQEQKRISCDTAMCERPILYQTMDRPLTRPFKLTAKNSPVYFWRGFPQNAREATQTRTTLGTRPKYHDTAAAFVDIKSLKQPPLDTNVQPGAFFEEGCVADTHHTIHYCLPERKPRRSGSLATRFKAPDPVTRRPTLVLPNIGPELFFCVLLALRSSVGWR
jgi:hypothetical protein